MLVKEVTTGEKLPKEELYCVTSYDSKGNKKNKYYLSEEAYNVWLRNKDNKKLCIDKMYDILGYKSFMKIPTIFYKKLSEWEPYEYDVVLLCMKNKEKDCRWAINNKQFNQESSKVMYICAILENSMNDALKQLVREKRLLKQEQSNDINIADNIDDIGRQGKDIERGSLVNSLLGNI